MRLVPLWRRLLRVAPAAVTRDQALAIARSECERLGYPWQEPVDVIEQLREYVIWTSAHTKGETL